MEPHPLFKTLMKDTPTGPAYPFLWGHPVVPIYGDISKNRHIAAYGKVANIAFLEYARKTAKSYMM